MTLSRALSLHGALNGRPLSRRHAPTPGPARCLPAPQPLGGEIGSVLASRQSRYDFDDRALALADLSTLLGCAVGVGRCVEAYGNAAHALGIAPSAGGLPSVAVHVAATRVEGLAGVYAYAREEHALLGLGGPAALAAVVHQAEFATRPAAVIALGLRLDLGLAKYPLRHYRTMHVDAGIALQNLYLVATALGLAGCAVSGFDDGAADEAFGLPADAVTAVLFAVGHGTG